MPAMASSTHLLKAPASFYCIKFNETASSSGDEEGFFIHASINLEDANKLPFITNDVNLTTKAKITDQEETSYMFVG